MTADDLLYDIVYLPRRFNESEDKSIYALLMETGYAGNPGSITVDGIRDFLSKHPDLVADWLGYSADKRTAGGWCFKEGADGGFLVAYLADDGLQKERQRSYDDGLECMCGICETRN